MKLFSKEKTPKQYTKGGIRETIYITLPMMVSLACETVMIFTDRMFLSRLSPELMSAALGGGVTSFMMMTFFIGLTGYTSALVAQYLGAGQKSKCALVVTQSMIIVLIGYPVILACRPLAYELFTFMGNEPSQLHSQKIFFDLLLNAAIISLLRNCFSCFFSGIGRTRIVMLSSLVSMGVNLLCAYILIFGHWGAPALGIRGAAYGTIIASFCGLLMMIVAYFSEQNRKEFAIAGSFRFDARVMRTLVKFGTPPGIEMFLNVLAFNAMVLVFHSVGPVAAAASTIVLNWDMVSYIPLMGLEIGVTSLVGRYMGARDTVTAQKATYSGLKLGFIFSSVIFILFAGFPEYLVNVFHTTGPNVIFDQAKPSAVFMIRAAALYVLTEAMFIVFIGALRGAGDTWWAMTASVIFHWIFVPVLFVLLKIFHFPIETGWLTVIFLFLCFSVVVIDRYRRGKWKNITVIPEEKTS